MSLADESMLIAQVMLTQDRHAFSQLVSFYQQPIRQYCRRLTAPDHALADDIAQECFVQAYKNMAQYSGRGKFQSWLFRIAYFAFLQHVRKQKPTEAYCEEKSACDNISPIADQRDLEQAMACLSTDERICLTLVFSFGYTQQECADILNKPLGSIKSYCKRGKDKLMVAMNENTNHQSDVA